MNIKSYSNKYESWIHEMKLNYQTLIIGLFILTIANYIVASEIKIDADSFEYDATIKKIVALGDVLVRQKDIEISGDRAEYKKNSQKITILNNVKITQNNINITADEAIADGVNEWLIVKGHVKFWNPKFKGNAEKVKYDILKQTLELTGNPLVKTNNDLISGAMINLNFATEKIKTLGPGMVSLSLESFR